MSETPSPPDLIKPKPNCLAWIGGVAALAGVLWLAALLTVGLTRSGAHPVELWMLLLAAAATATMTAVVLGINYAQHRATAHNHGIIVESIGRLASEMEQLSTRIEKIDPMAIYAAVAGDLLNQDRRP